MTTNPSRVFRTVIEFEVWFVTLKSPSATLSFARTRTSAALDFAIERAACTREIKGRGSYCGEGSRDGYAFADSVKTAWLIAVSAISAA